MLPAINPAPRRHSGSAHRTAPGRYAYLRVPVTSVATALLCLLPPLPHGLLSRSLIPFRQLYMSGRAITPTTDRRNEMANNTNGKPVAEIRVGRITATIWQNTPTDDGVFYSVHITRLFRRGSTWDRTPAFGRDDLLTVAKVADLANTRIYELQNAIEFRNPQDDADDAA